MPAAISAAQARAASSSFPWGTTASTRPSLAAFLSLMGALVSIICAAVCRPTRRGSRCVPPKPGRMPSCSSGRPSFVPARQQGLHQCCASLTGLAGNVSGALCRPSKASISAVPASLASLAISLERCAGPARPPSVLCQPQQPDGNISGALCRLSMPLRSSKPGTVSGSRHAALARPPVFFPGACSSV